MTFKYIPGREYKIKSLPGSTRVLTCVDGNRHGVGRDFKLGYIFLESGNNISAFNHKNNVDVIEDLLELIKTSEEIEAERRAAFVRADELEANNMYRGTGVHSDAVYVTLPVGRNASDGYGVVLTASDYYSKDDLPMACPAFTDGAAGETLFELVGPVKVSFATA